MKKNIEEKDWVLSSKTEPGMPMQMPEIVTQSTAPLILRPLTKATPNVDISCIRDANAPRIEVSEISAEYIGATKAYDPALNPKTDINLIA